jgi:hypothetical protein
MENASGLSIQERIRLLNQKKEENKIEKTIVNTGVSVKDKLSQLEGNSKFSQVFKGSNNPVQTFVPSSQRKFIPAEANQSKIVEETKTQPKEIDVNQEEKPTQVPDDPVQSFLPPAQKIPAELEGSQSKIVTEELKIESKGTAFKQEEQPNKNKFSELKANLEKINFAPQINPSFNPVVELNITQKLRNTEENLEVNIEDTKNNPVSLSELNKPIRKRNIKRSDVEF